MKSALLPALALAAATTLPALAQPPAQPAATIPQALLVAPAKGGAKLTVTSSAFANGAPIPLDNSAWGANQMPGLAWTAGPAGTQSYAVILEDTDYTGVGGRPFGHWWVVNIPASVTRMAAGTAAAPGGGIPEAAVQGTGMRGRPAVYFGPRTPPGTPHHYRFQVFALDKTLSTAAGGALPAIIDEMKDHVLASGELVGTYVGTAPPAATPATK